MTKKLLITLATILLFGVLLAACGGGSTTSASPTATPAPAVSQSSEPVVSEQVRSYCDDTASVQFYRDCMSVAKDQAGREQASEKVSECLSQMNTLEYFLHQLWPWGSDCN